ncbi:MAG: hypothetical protein ABI581_04965 [Sediminibacterium sp.]
MLTNLSQLTIDLSTVSITFRCGFVLFLFLVMFLMRDEDKKKGVGRIND